MEEVPLAERALLALDQEQVSAGEDEESLLILLAVVHARGLPVRGRRC